MSALAKPSWIGMLQTDQPSDYDAGAGAQTNHLQPRASEQALHSGSHPWSQSALLLHCHQLQVKRHCFPGQLDVAAPHFFSGCEQHLTAPASMRKFGNTMVICQCHVG